MMSNSNLEKYLLIAHHFLPDSMVLKNEIYLALSVNSYSSV